MSISLSGNLSGQIDEMLQGSVVGGVSLNTSGHEPVIQEKSITANGDYSVPAGVDGFNPVHVNVPAPLPVIQEKSITANGDYSVPAGVDGFNPVHVNVPAPLPVIQEKSITANGDYSVPAGVDGFNPVHVNVPSSKEVGFNYNYIISNNSGITVKGGSTINSLSTLWDGDYRIECAIKGQYDITSYNKVILFIGYLGDSYKHRFSGQQDNWNFYLLLTKNIMTSTYLTPSTLISSSESDVYQKIDVTTNYDSALLYYELNIPHNDGARYINLHIPGIALTDVKVSLI